MSAFADSPRHGPVHFPFGAGLNVLYGLNGAGKSRTLRGIASLLGSDVADLGAGLYGQLFVDPDATLGDTYEPATVAGIVEDVAQLLLSRFTRAVEPWERHEFEDYIEVDQPNDDIGTASTLGGLAAAIAAELRLPKTVISSLGGGGRLLYCPRAGGGADLYLGLQVRDPALGELAEEARALREAVVALPPEEERDVATECNFTWFTDEEHPDWLQRVQRHWSRLIQEKREQMEATFEQANVVDRLRELSAVLGTVPTLDHLALLYVMGHLAAQRDHASAIPAWASVPIIHLGVAYQSKARWREDFRAITTSAHESDEAFVTLEALLRDALVRLAEDEEVALFESHSSTVQLNAALRRHLIEFAQLASTILQEVLGPDAPTLEVRVSPEDAIRTGAPVRVLADDFSIFESVDVRELSDAQRRWAVIALRLAFAEFFLRSGGPVPAPLFVLLDEPDASLHLLARRALAEGLANLTQRFRVPFVVSTHSVELIDHPSVLLWHTRRSGARIDLTRATVGDMSGLDAQLLGVRSSDLLLLTRVWLVVEGEHDRAVLEAWVGDEFQRYGVRTLIMRGTRRSLSVLDSELLFDGTDAAVAVLLDNTRADLTTRVNECLRKLAEEPDKRAATIGSLSDLLRSQASGTEAASVVELALAAARRGMAHRLMVMGFSKPDIIEYLPAGAFAEGSSWGELVNEWHASGRSTDSGLDFKSWLRKAKGAQISARRLGQIASTMDSIPGDAIDLLKHLELASSLRRGR